MSFREFWLAWREQWRAFPSVRRWWDLGKVRAKLFCRDYTRGTSRRQNAAIEQLEREVLEMERRLAADPEDPSLCGACREKREELRALEDHRARGAFVRSRIRLLREMDRGSRFFYALEKTRGAKKHVTCLLAEDGTPLTDPEEMCGRARDFYTSLFSPDPTDPDASLRRMPTNKSPGMDGLTVEFYRAFWDILGPDLVIVWAESLQSGVLPLSCRRAVLALLPKKGDLRDLRNWRPVSLLSTDYKIVAKAISLRLGSVMADVVHPDQTYTVPGRSIFDNLFLVRDLLELGRRDGLSFALLSLDQEKAFDRVDHGYLLSTLQAFGFGPQFVSFLRVLYASAECLVRLNWTLTEPVSFGRGVRQGCPLSGQLYALAIEPFLCLLRRRMTGLVLREPELRLVLSAYADDVLLVVQDPGDLARVEACQAIYSAASSARVNWVKSSGLAVGDWWQPVGGQELCDVLPGVWLAWREQWRAFPSVRRWWDLGKVRAKLFCRDYTRGTSRWQNAAIEQLEREVLEMERRLAADPEDPSLCGACREKREELRALEDHRARGAFIRSRIRLLRKMDRGSRFFYALEKTRGAKKHVTCLLAEDGTPLTDPEEMCGRARDIYTSLFSPDPTDPGACRVLWEELPMVSVGDQDRLELPLTLAEFSEALRRMPTNKSLGMDGLTVEFYRAFWDILGPDLVTVWAESLQSGVLPLSCRRAVLALLPKKGDLRNLRNWRPVSLLSTDYKIVAKAISLRLGSVLADVIHPDQTYTIPDHSIFDNLFLVRDLVELGRRDSLSFALLSLDQEKAFDRVDHGYLLSTLQAFGFGPQFVGFLQVLYTFAECLVKLNWTLTEPVSFGRGVRQGCPLSGQLYALAIEPFLCLLRRRMTGLVLRKPELRLVLSAYADDILLVVQDPGDLARV
ncbi:unnamed protein product [Caretta caretta]